MARSKLNDLRKILREDAGPGLTIISVATYAELVGVSEGCLLELLGRMDREFATSELDTAENVFKYQFRRRRRAT